MEMEMETDEEEEEEEEEDWGLKKRGRCKGEYLPHSKKKKLSEVYVRESGKAL